MSEQVDRGVLRLNARNCTGGKAEVYKNYSKKKKNFTSKNETKSKK
jgi:hypothetical protein